MRTRLIEKPFDLVHLDLCGPIEVNSFSGCRYFIVLEDDYTKYCWTKALKRKSECISVIINLCRLWKNQYGTYPKILRSDNGGEFLNKKLIEFFRQHGIIHETSVPYCPAQNGSAERMIRTISEKARCIMLHAKLSKVYWAEAISTATYLYNRTILKKLKLTPYKKLNKRPPTYDRLKTFGCICFAKINSGKNKKFDSKSIKCRFLGYAEHQKGYRLLNLTNKRIIVSNDVIFLEDKFETENNHNFSENKILWDKFITISSDEYEDNDNLNMEQNLELTEDKMYVEWNQENNPNTLKEKDKLKTLETVDHQIENTDKFKKCFTNESITNTSKDEQTDNNESKDSELYVYSDDSDNELFDSPSNLQTQDSELYVYSDDSDDELLDSLSNLHTQDINTTNNIHYEQSESTLSDQNSVEANSTESNSNQLELLSKTSEINTNTNADERTVEMMNINSPKIKKNVTFNLQNPKYKDIKQANELRNINLYKRNRAIALSPSATPRRSKRLAGEPPEYANIANEKDPKDYKEAMNSTNAAHWKRAIESEMKSMIENQVFEEVDLPKNKKPIQSKWVFKLKYNSDGTINKFKARLVAKGYTQKYGIDYKEKFAPVAKFDSLRLLLSIAAQQNLILHQLDITTAFLYGDLDEEIYMQPPDGINTTKVWKLKRGL